MAKVDIPIPDELQEALNPPRCLDVKLPEPEKLEVRLPSGGTLQALNDLGKGIPNDCSLTFSLMVQLGPLLGSMDCLLKILKLLKPLSDAITNFPPTPGLIKDVAEATADLAPCFLMLTPAGMIPFVCDLLRLIIKLLRCLIGQLETLVGMMAGLTVQLEAARRVGSDDLVATLECAQENALISAQHLLQAFEPVGALLDLAAPLMSIAGVQAIQLPALGGDTDVAALNDALETLRDVVNTMQQIVDGVCP